MIDKIRNDKQYQQVMTMIEGYLQKATDGGGFQVLSQKEGIRCDPDVGFLKSLHQKLGIDGNFLLENV